jgi:hypothetical protein
MAIGKKLRFEISRRGVSACLDQVEAAALGAGMP